MIKNILNYIKYSNLLIIFNLNPFSWHIDFSWVTKNDMDPGLVVDTYLEFGPVKLVLWIDNGSW